jgi:predicted nucleic acid binding AN1-type Zn finger protein
MEFDHVGLHCEFESCNQKDFLPFKCADCSKMFCLLHRSTVAHNCIVVQSRDKISMECPICKKSIKMNRSDDPNVEWDRHFTNECTQKPGNNSRPQKCLAQHCITLLGPSNVYTCNLCHGNVCLSHRIPEHHQCPNHKQLPANASDAVKLRYANMNSTSSDSSSGAKNPNNSSAVKNKSHSSMGAKNNKNGNKIDPSNTLLGSAARRKVEHNNAYVGNVSTKSSTVNTMNSSTERLECPFGCGLFDDVNILTSHINSLHNEQSTSSSSSGLNSNRSGDTGNMPEVIYSTY